MAPVVQREEADAAAPPAGGGQKGGAAAAAAAEEGQWAATPPTSNRIASKGARARSGQRGGAHESGQPGASSACVHRSCASCFVAGVRRTCSAMGASPEALWLEEEAGTMAHHLVGKPVPVLSRLKGKAEGASGAARR